MQERRGGDLLQARSRGRASRKQAAQKKKGGNAIPSRSGPPFVGVPSDNNNLAPSPSPLIPVEPDAPAQPPVPANRRRSSTKLGGKFKWAISTTKTSVASKANPSRALLAAVELEALSLVVYDPPEPDDINGNRPWSAGSDLSVGMVSTDAGAAPSAVDTPNALGSLTQKAVLKIISRLRSSFTVADRKARNAADAAAKSPSAAAPAPAERAGGFERRAPLPPLLTIEPLLARGSTRGADESGSFPSRSCRAELCPTGVLRLVATEGGGDEDIVMAPTAGSPTLLRRGGSQQQQPVAAAANSSNANLFPLPIALCGTSLAEQPGLRSLPLHQKSAALSSSASAAASAGESALSQEMRAHAQLLQQQQIAALAASQYLVRVVMRGGAPF